MRCLRRARASIHSVRSASSLLRKEQTQSTPTPQWSSQRPSMSTSNVIRTVSMSFWRREAGGGLFCSENYHWWNMSSAETRNSRRKSNSPPPTLKRLSLRLPSIIQYPIELSMKYSKRLLLGKAAISQVSVGLRVWKGYSMIRLSWHCLWKAIEYA